MLQTFDAPVMETNCEYRPVSTVATQSLMLLNGEFTMEQAGHLADRILREQAASPIQPGGPAVLDSGLSEAGKWSYGTGIFNEKTGQLDGFSALNHFTGSQWQGAAELPGGVSGWALLHAQGGHPGNPSYPVVRRWTAPCSGKLNVTGRLEHQSANGDGVRGRIVSSRGGALGSWQAHNNMTQMTLKDVVIEPGDTLDFVVECLAHETSDSFLWPIQIEITASDGRVIKTDSAADFHGPGLSVAQWQAQVQRAWQLALVRAPRDDEQQAALAFAAAQLAELNRDKRGVLAGSTPERQVLVNLCQMLFNSNEFLYVD
jgi:hypothetical protein